MARYSLVAFTLIGCVSLSACSTTQPASVSSSTATPAPGTSGSPAVANEPAIKVMSCTQTLTFDRAPERVVLLGDDSIPFMNEMGLLDKVVALGEPIPEGIYSDELMAKLSSIPLLDHVENATGGSQVSTETLLAANPDLVVGYDSGADRAALTQAGVPFYSPDAWCPDVKTSHAIFHDINDEVRKYAAIFDVADEGEALIKRMNARVAEIKSMNATPRGTGMALYASQGKTTYTAYGNGSMVQPMFEAVGLENVYANRDERIIRDTAIEAILTENPGTVVLLYQRDDPEALKQAFVALPGAQDLDAVKNNKVYALPFVYTDPPTPNTIEGVEKLNELLGS
ncbi:ABC transporter substrate-binding protein [Stomatohabitans albus]|uniref:ABC transporter substrate-binding protein n=1 Tax=Stomatohabitans albus TaxID=3110766 RepID=UPI00300D6520